METRRLGHRCTGAVVLSGLALSLAAGPGAVCAGFAGGRVAVSQAGTSQRRPAEGGQQSPTPARQVTDDYTIGPADVLAINVWKEAELTRTVTVRPDGKISLPLVGELQVGGLTANKVQALIVQRLAAYVTDPQVTVMIQDVKSQTYVIVGKVAKTGSYELGKPTTVLEAIAIAGGFLDFAKVSKVKIIRPRAGGQPETLYFDYKQVIKGKNSEQNIVLKNGDTIVVP